MEKITVLLTNYNLGIYENEEITLEDFNKKVNDQIELAKKIFKENMELDNYELVKFALMLEKEYDDHNSNLVLNVYRTETDKELKKRLESIKFREEADRVRKEKKEENKKKKEKILEELNKNEEYLKFLELKKKFS